MNVITCQDIAKYSGQQVGYMLLNHADDTAMVFVTPEAFGQLEIREHAHPAGAGALRWNVEGVWLIVKKYTVFADPERV